LTSLNCKVTAQVEVNSSC